MGYCIMKLKVSHHALVRYLERRYGYEKGKGCNLTDIELLRAWKINTDRIRNELRSLFPVWLEDAHCSIKSGDIVAVIRDNTIVTIKQAATNPGYKRFKGGKRAAYKRRKKTKKRRQERAYIGGKS